MKRITFLLLFFHYNVAKAELSTFFANKEIQRKKPEAFALQPETNKFLQDVRIQSFSDKKKFFNYLNSDFELKQAIKNWKILTMDEKIPFLRKIFSLQVASMNIQAPELIFDDANITSAAYFDFHLNGFNAGKVYLNTKKLSEEKNAFASMALLIHETRHSAQLQLAFTSDTHDVVAKTYLASFRAQKELKNLSFCDFLTLANEYEAFEFGNYIIGELTGYQEDMPDMGTFASQYNNNGSLKIDLLDLLKRFGSHLLLDQFNELEKLQFEQLKLL